MGGRRQFAVARLITIRDLRELQVSGLSLLASSTRVVNLSDYKVCSSRYTHVKFPLIGLSTESTRAFGFASALVVFPFEMANIHILDQANTSILIL